MRYPWLFLFVLTAAVVDLIDGCGRTPTAQTSTESPLELTTELNISSGHHQHDCSRKEYMSTGCLYGGKCYVYIINDYRQTACNCPKEYVGDRCERLSHDIFFPVEEDIKIQTAGIAAAAVGFTLFCSMIICCVIVHIRRKRKERRDHQLTCTSNGSLIPPDSNGISVHNGMHNSQEKVPMADWIECDAHLQVETNV